MTAIWKKFGLVLPKRCVHVKKKLKKMKCNISKHLFNMKADLCPAFYLNNSNILIQELKINDPLLASEKIMASYKLMSNFPSQNCTQST